MEATGDKDVVIVFNEESGFKQHLLRPDAETLLDKLIEFQSKEGSTDVSLSAQRGLAVVGTGNGVRFSFFYREQGPQTWIPLDKSQTEKAITQLTTLLKR